MKVQKIYYTIFLTTLSLQKEKEAKRKSSNSMVFLAYAQRRELAGRRYNSPIDGELYLETHARRRSQYSFEANFIQPDKNPDITT